ncbi:1aa27437-0e3f-49f3-828c-21c5fee6622b [Thermothielavioides terrestris]|uniref:DUF1917-domain-containing protein n=2 Tax=Thermothielavioides terrestris TaxID=2587410 RepID=G2R724_THETT|nr:uncharacterized protein THITE_2116756 [Thermothielavioides terrestris NRRL 8126]AEO67752.1 hypothetical protein THITE_2116756 [Thermothielavioides terrestris NRRL 8126]SPQ25878.1 1aa27437-0e3f-49f3-828c-21c5fee6622b [Thermothielavioides terrestris]
MDSESDFYGDEETVSVLEDRVANFDVVSWWDRHRPMASYIQQTARNLSAGPAPGCLYNKYEGEPGARQLSESVDDFLARLPPATTDWRPGLDWIFIANPYEPPGPGAALDRFMAGGEERLQLLEAFENMVTASSAGGMAGRSLAKLQKDVAKERRAAVEDLRQLAVVCNVVLGKWMLFPEPGSVNSVWAKVARATANNELGVSAKVETRVDSQKARLICVYTRDFRDKDDVARVLNRLRQLELVSPGGKQIYYKSDAWTHLGIYGGNRWGIQASMYSSNELFAYIRTLASRRP